MCHSSWPWSCFGCKKSQWHTPFAPRGPSRPSQKRLASAWSKGEDEVGIRFEKRKKKKEGFDIQWVGGSLITFAFGFLTKARIRLSAQVSEGARRSGRKKRGPSGRLEALTLTNRESRENSKIQRSVYFQKVVSTLWILTIIHLGFCGFVVLCVSLAGGRCSEIKYSPP